MLMLRRWDEWNQRSITRPRPYYRVVPSPTGDRYYEVAVKTFAPGLRFGIVGGGIIGSAVIVALAALFYLRQRTSGELIEVEVRSARSGEPVHTRRVGTWKAARGLIDEWDSTIRSHGPGGLAPNRLVYESPDGRCPSA